MAIQDYFEIQAGKAFANESFDVASHLAVATTQVTSIPTSQTTLSGEIGTREALSISRTDNEVTYSAIRSGANVIDTTNGDDLKSAGTMTASTSGNLMDAIILSGITQTTNFDIDFEFKVTFERK